MSHVRSALREPTLDNRRLGAGQELCAEPVASILARSDLLDDAPVPKLAQSILHPFEALDMTCLHGLSLREVAPLRKIP